MVNPPKCARYGCENRIQRERWLWTPGSVATCSPECAHALRLESIVKEIGEVQRCARPGCLNAVKDKRHNYCSGRCAARVQMGEALGDNLRIFPGDRWKKVAPRMKYTEAVRGQEIRELYRAEVGRTYRSA